MPYVHIGFTGFGTPDWQHTSVTIAAGATVLTVPLTDTKVSHSGWTAAWKELPRPGQQPLQRRGASQLKQMRMQIILATPNGDPVDSLLDTLKSLGNTDDPVVVAYGRSEVGHWRLVDAQPVTTERDEANNATRVDVDLTFREAVADNYVPQALTQ